MAPPVVVTLSFNAKMVLANFECVEQIMTEGEISVLKGRKMDKLKKALFRRGLIPS